MNYWLLSLPREDMEHCIKVGTFGSQRKGVLGRVQKGDKVACYVTKECKVIALGEALSDYYMDDKKIFKASGVFPDRFDFKASLLGSNNEIDFKTMVDDLGFITNKIYWTVYLRSGIAQMSHQDWNLVQTRNKVLAN